MTPINWKATKQNKKSESYNRNVFLRKFGFRGNTIPCYAEKGDRSPRMYTFVDNDWNLDEHNIRNKKDVYFYINAGGTKAAEITHLRACFIDLDAGKSASGNYLEPRTVERRKEKMRARILEFSHKPNIITETRNGYHLYWLFEGEVENTQENLLMWEVMQKRIYNFFSGVGGDNHAQRVNQIFRIGWTWWYKNWSKATKYLVKSFYPKNEKYNFAELYKELKQHTASAVAKKDMPWELNPSNPINKTKVLVQEGDEIVAKPTKFALNSKVKKILSKLAPVEAEGESEILKVTQETIEFLVELSSTLAYSKPFMAKSAMKLAKRLTFVNGLKLPYIKM